MLRIEGTGLAGLDSSSENGQLAVLLGGSPGQLALSQCSGIEQRVESRWIVAAKPAGSTTALHTRVFAAGPKGPTWSGTGYVIPSPDGGEIWEFACTGRHFRTRDALTGQVILEFTYHDNPLVGVTEPHRREGPDWRGLG